MSSRRAATAPPGSAPGGAVPVWSASRARRVVLGAQGLAGPRPAASARRVAGVAARLGVVQVDSVDVLARAHLMPFHSRLEDVDPAHVAALTEGRGRRFTEAWAHEASIVPATSRAALTLLQGRRWPLATALPEDRRTAAAADIRALLAAHGPLTAREVRDRRASPCGPGTSWGWNWSEDKRVLEHLFAEGSLASAGRTASFERRYALPELLWPQGESGRAPVPPEPAAGGDARLAAALQLTRIALRAQGVGTADEIADHHRAPVTLTRRALEVLADRGEALEVRLDLGGTRPVPAWADPTARTPRRAGACTLLNPFDPAVFHRPRVERLFGVRYRLGIYTPVDRRVRGYYPLLLLQGERLTAQADLGAVRRGPDPRLELRGAWSEDPAAHPGPAGPGPTPDEVADALAGEALRAARWRGLPRVVVPEGAPGDLAPRVRRALLERDGGRVPPGP